MLNKDPNFENKESHEILKKFTNELLLKLDKNYNPKLLPDNDKSELNEKNLDQLQATQVETESHKCQTITSNIKQSGFLSDGKEKSYPKDGNEFLQRKREREEEGEEKEEEKKKKKI